ncbi:hypothetical protein LTR12_014331 [Friedmanniomyces endolithicus]|nr:hypothetical protein LTR74_002573 [Friedmanniomyces endolithicus]KAK1811299.1 hypothetical protein LTR12_014331 [Friedmanniomyces endolithicus]
MLCRPFVRLPSLKEVLKVQQTEAGEKHSTNRLPPLEPIVDARPRESAIYQPNERLFLVKEVLQGGSGDPAAGLTGVQSPFLSEVLRAAPEDVPAHQTVLHPPPFRADDLPQHPTGHLPTLQDDPAITTSMLGGRAMLTAEQEGWGGEQRAPSSPAVSNASQLPQPQQSQQQELLQTAMRKNFEQQAMRRELKRQKQICAKEVRRRQKERRWVRIQKHSDFQHTTSFSNPSPSKPSTLPRGSQRPTEGVGLRMSSVVSVANQPEQQVEHQPRRQSAFTDMLRRPNFKPAGGAAAAAFASTCATASGS